MFVFNRFNVIFICYYENQVFRLTFADEKISKNILFCFFKTINKYKIDNLCGRRIQGLKTNPQTIIPGHYVNRINWISFIYLFLIKIT